MSCPSATFALRQGLAPDVPLREIDLEPEVLPIPEDPDPYVAEMPFPHAAPGPAENELLGGRVPDVDLVVSAINIPMPARLKNAPRTAVLDS